MLENPASFIFGAVLATIALALLVVAFFDFKDYLEDQKWLRETRQRGEREQRNE